MKKCIINKRVEKNNLYNMILQHYIPEPGCPIVLNPMSPDLSCQVSHGN